MSENPMMLFLVYLASFLFWKIWRMPGWTILGVRGVKSFVHKLKFKYTHTFVLRLSTVREQL